MTTADATLTVGATAPDAELTTVDGAPVRLSALWHERPLVLVFLAPLGGRYCIDNAIQLRDARENILKAGADLVAVGSRSVPKAVAFRDPWQIPFSLLIDPNEEAYRAFGVTTERPGSFVIDSEGVIQFAHHNQSALETPSTWALVDTVSSITGQAVEKPMPTPIDPTPSEGPASAVPRPGESAPFDYHCVKCGNVDYEVLDVSTSSGMLSRMFNFQNRRFSAVICRRCKYTELYKTESGKLRHVIDIVAGT